MYKRTGGNTTTLHNHLKNKHPDKTDNSNRMEVNRNSGTIDRFVTNAIPVSFLIFFLIFFY